MLKFASFQVIEAKTARLGFGLMKNAHRHFFEYDPKPGFLYVRSRAISSRCNDNFDDFPADEIKAAYRTFIGKPVFVNHVNADHRRSRGVIVDAALHEDINPDGSVDTWAEVLMEVDAINFPKLAEKILNGEVNKTSMGCDVGFSTCSFCGNEARTPMEYCSHIKVHKGQRIRRRMANGSGYEDILVREICHKISFFENSILVEDPADPTAFFLGVESGDELSSLGTKTASRETATHQTQAKTISVDEISTMVDVLAGKLRDSDFGNISDLCEVSVKGTNLFCEVSKRIPRSQMPQLSDDSKDITKDWLKSLKDAGVSVREENAKAASLKATQNQLNGKKVASIADKMKSGGMSEVRICVSNDGYIVDGHHRWAAKICVDLLDGDLGDAIMPVTRIGMEIIKLIDNANDFAKENGISQRGINAALRALAVGVLDTPVSEYGMVYDSDVVMGQAVREADAFHDWDSLQTESLPSGVTLYATERMLSSESIAKVDGSKIRPNYDVQIVKDEANRHIVVDGHHRVAIYKNAGVPLPVKILDLSKTTSSLDVTASIIFDSIERTAMVGSPGYLSRDAFDALQSQVKVKVSNAPTPTQADIERNLKAMREDGRAGGDFRGNSYDRRRRSQRLLEEFGNGNTCGCAYCGKLLDASNLTEDKIVTGKLGGRYILPNLIPACQPCNARRSDNPFSLTSSIKTAGRIVNMSQVVVGDVVRFPPQSDGYTVVRIEPIPQMQVNSDSPGVRLHFDRPLLGGRDTMSGLLTDTIFVEKPGRRQPDLSHVPPPTRPTTITGHCPVCGRNMTISDRAGRVSRHNGYHSGGSACPASGLMLADAEALGAKQRADDRERQRWGSKTSSYGTLWRSSTGVLHKSMMCPNLSSKSNVSPVPVDDLEETRLVEKEGKNACSLCFPSAPSRRSGVETFAIKRVALGEKRAPADVDTLRDEACPVCGEKDAYTGDECRVCGFVKPPDAFLDPDVDMAKQVDLHQEAVESLDANSPVALQCNNCGETFGDSGAQSPSTSRDGGVERFKVAFLPEPDKSGVTSEDAIQNQSPKAGDNCPKCGKGTLDPVESTSSTTEEVEDTTGEGTTQVDPETGVKEISDDIEDDDDEEEDTTDVPKERSRHKKESIMRPALRALAEQQIIIQSQGAAIQAIADAAGIDISNIQRNAGRRVAAFRKKADANNPANPIPEPAPEAPAVTTEEAKTPEARVDVTEQGGVPANTDVPPDATTSVTEPGVVLPVEQSPQNAQDPSKPVQGTQEPQDGKIEGDVTIGDPNDSTTMFSETGWTASTRSMAAIRLARLRMESGIAPTQDDLALGQAIASSKISDADLQKEINTLAAVASARPRQAQAQTAGRRLVPRAASAQRSAPSLAPQTSDLPGVSMSPTSDEINW